MFNIILHLVMNILPFALLIFFALNPHCIPSLFFSVIIIITARLLDLFSTYLCVLRFGLLKFFALEQNERLKEHVGRYGLESGFLMDLVDPVWFYHAAIVLLLLGTMQFFLLMIAGVNEHHLALRMSVAGSFVALGSVLLTAAVNNFCAFFNIF